MTKDEALRLALEALERSVATCFDPYSHEQVMSRPEHFINQAITAIEAALANEALERKAENARELGLDYEPVAWLHRFIEGGISIGLKPLDLERHPERWEPLYTTPPQQELVCVCGAVWEGQELVETPPQRTWVGLTDEEILDKCESVPDYDIGNRDLIHFARAIEAKLKEKNT